MNQNISVQIVVLLVVAASYLPIALSETTRYKFLKFSNQSEHPVNEAINFATLNYGSLGNLSTNKLTICGSIYIGFYRGYQAFYTVNTKGNKNLYLSLSIDNQDTTEEIYTAILDHLGGSVLSITGAKLRLNPHSWSHACTSVDGESGVVIVFFNGVLAFNTTIKSKEITRNFPTVFQRNLVLGTRVFQGVGHKSQSEASVKNVNVFTGNLNLLEMLNITLAGQWAEGDVVSWSKSMWTSTGSVEEVLDTDVGQTFHFPHLYKIADGFNKWSDCISICPRIQAGGRLPFTRHLMDAKHLSQLYSQGWFWAPFTYQTEGNFTDHYTKTALESEMWIRSEPNGGLREQCTFWKGGDPEGKIYDVSCTFWSRKLQCLCQFERSPIIRMRGLCQGSKIDTHYTLKHLNGTVVFMGLKGTVIRFQPIVLKWTLNVNLETTMGLSTAEEDSFIMGKQEWTIEGDSTQCNRGQPYTSQLKMSGCNTDGEFTCDDGQCVSMEQRCDQLPDCRDKSDERRCKMLVTEEGYNKEVPPFTVSSKDRSIVPITLKISIDLLKIVDMDEKDHKIDFQFKITLQWKENNRVLYHNLKKDTSLNTLSKDDIKSLWLPLVIYDNTDQKEVTRLGEYGNGEWNTLVLVIREGNFTRSSFNMVDETEIFEGSQNTLFMQQVYTWQFQCKYNLQEYPFDTQV